MSESIYSWIKEAPPPPEKPPMYHSKHDPLTKPYGASSTFAHVASKKEFGSIGREVKPAVHPTRYLKAHEKTGAAPTDERPLRALLLLRSPCLLDAAGRAASELGREGCCKGGIFGPRARKTLRWDTTHAAHSDVCCAAATPVSQTQGLALGQQRGKPRC
jgi:hypothetical protein